MKKFLFLFLFAMSGYLSFAVPVTIPVGASSTYQTIRAAYNSLVFPIGGPVVIELQSDYAPSGDEGGVQMLVKSANPANTITITVAAGAGPFTYNPVVPAANEVFYLRGAKYVIIDGRNLMTINNDHGSGKAITFDQGASNNIVRNCVISGFCPSNGGGVVVFGAQQASATGCDNNVIEYCRIKAGSAATPINLIFSTSVNTTQSHDNNTIRYCELSDNHNNLYSSSGIFLGAYNNAWTITNNHFYQTTSRVVAFNLCSYGVNISSPTGSGFTINNNFFGGTAANCGGTALTITGAGFYRAIYMVTGITIFNEINSNTFKNIDYSSTNNSNVNSLITFADGRYHFGMSGGNTIGSMTATDDIHVRLTGTNTWYSVINVGVGGTPTWFLGYYNNIGGITFSDPNLGVQPPRFGIFFADFKSYNYVQYNNIGGSVANSIHNTSNGLLYAIFSTSGMTSWQQGFSGNTIQNMSSDNTGNKGQVLGIYGGDGGYYRINSNIITDLTTNSSNPGTDNFASVIGICVNAKAQTPNVIDLNVVKNLSNTNTTGAVYVSGINFSASNLLGNKIDRNNIYNLSIESSSTSAGMSGIDVDTANVELTTNMISLSSNGNHILYGIESHAIYNLKAYYNSVYIGGSPSIANNNTAAMSLRNTSATMIIKDNILYNARTSTGKNYALVIGTATGVLSNYNDLYSSNSNNIASYNGGTTPRTLEVWSTNTGQDANSVSTAIVFVNTASDLHLVTASALDGVTIPGITADCDGQTRPAVPCMGFDDHWTTWTGAANSRWDVLANWTNGTPKTYSYATIPSVTNKPSVSWGDGVARTVEISVNGGLTIAPTKTLTVNGTVINNGSSSDLIVKSDATGTGNLIASNLVSGIAQRYIKTTSNANFHYFGSPITSAPSSVLSGPYTYTSFASYPIPGSGYPWNIMAANLAPGVGYSKSFTTATTIAFDGTLNTGKITPTLSSTASDWNFLGNPYPCAIDATKFVTANTTITGTLYFWSDDNSGGYGYTAADYATWTTLGGVAANGVTPNGYIGSTQGFFVQSLTGATNALFTNDMKASTNTQFIIANPITVQKLNLSIRDSKNNVNAILVGFHPQATAGYDRLLDGAKLKGNNSISLYTLMQDNNSEYAIQALAPINTETVVPVGIDANIGGLYTFTVTNFENFDGKFVYLEDLYTHKLIELSNNASYSFTSKEGTFKDRFVLRFSVTKLTNNVAQTVEGIKVYSVDKTIFVNVSSEYSNGRITVYNMLGKEIASKDLSENNFDNMITLNENSGYYIVKVSSNEVTKSTNLFIR